MDPTLESIKMYPRAMHFYIYTIYEFVLEMKCKKVLTLGIQNGQADRAILLALGQNKFGTLVSVDHKNRSTILDTSFRDYKKYWKFIRGDTTKEETIKAVKETLKDDEQFDFLLIDAGHDYESVKQDWDNYTPLVRSGGVVFLHDTVNKNAGVNKLWKEITFEKFNCNWGLARSNIIVGMGIVKIP